MGYLRSWQALPRAQLWMILGLAAAVALANVDQPFPEIAPLQHAPTVLLILSAPPLLARWPLSTGAVAAIVAFLLLHSFAGRWTYSNVPYDLWSREVLGASIDRMLGVTRNDFDRIVHLCFGLLAIRPFAEVAQRHGGMGRRAALVSALLFVGAVSAVYEIFEWLLTLVVAPDQAADYNGQQGDMWDSQKDMACAIVGGIVALALRQPRPGRSRLNG